MDTRIGYPNEHLAGDSEEEFSSPLYATAVGLVMNSIENKTKVLLGRMRLFRQKWRLTNLQLMNIRRESKKKLKR
jgi:cell division protein FtsA